MAKMIVVVLGILIAALLVFMLVSWIAEMVFNHKVDQEVDAFFNEMEKGDNTVITEADIEALPGCIQKWLKNAMVIGQEKVFSARLKQKGVMRTKQESPWMPFQAEQYFRTDEPGFIWKAKMKAAPMFNIVARDQYVDGHGNMLIKMLALKTISDATGKEMDQGTLLRYLAELQWFPAGALSPVIQWEEIDSNSAKATMRYQGVAASALYQFNSQGELVYFEAERYGEFDGRFSLETWSGVSHEYKVMDGVKIPTKGEVTWKLKTGDFTWLKWEITEIEYNIPDKY
jgi:hypothetical protein